MLLRLILVSSKKSITFLVTFRQKNNNNGTGKHDKSAENKIYKDYTIREISIYLMAS